VSRCRLIYVARECTGMTTEEFALFLLFHQVDGYFPVFRLGNVCVLEKLVQLPGKVVQKNEGTRGGVTVGLG
jgi:hypothetical protein